MLAVGLNAMALKLLANGSTHLSKAIGACVVGVAAITSMGAWAQESPFGTNPALSDQPSPVFVKPNPKPSFANPIPKRVKEAGSEKNQNIMKLIYTSKVWNRDSSQIDTAYVWLRDQNARQTAKILLEETAPDSGVFEGYFQIKWGSMSQLSPMVYIPDFATSTANDPEVVAAIESGNLQPKPLFAHLENQNLLIAQVFDDLAARDQAKEAYQKAQMPQVALTPSLVATQALESSMAAEKKVLVENLRSEAEMRELERHKMAEAERQKQEKLREQALKAEQKQREERAREAEGLAAQGMAAYRKGDYVNAESLFRKAREANPLENSYNFFFAVTLYRNEKLDEALVALKLTPDSPQIHLEKLYYQGLIHYRLKEIDQAVIAFKQVAQAKKSTLAPSALFYLGVIDFNLERWQSAQKHFENVIDVSKDPGLDTQAEDYIDKIANILAFKKEQATQFILNASTGISYDSNILLVSDTETSQGIASNKGGARLTAIGSGEYRMLYTPTQEASAKLQSTYLYSLDSQFASADPWLSTFTLPYALKGMAWSKGYKFGLTPGFEILYMDPNNTGTRSDILNSVFVTTENLFVMSPSWISSYIFEIRNDKSYLPNSIGDDDYDARKFTIKTNQTVFTDTTKKRAVIGSLGYVLNAADGANRKFSRIDLGAAYIAPFERWKNASWLFGLSAYYLNYPSASPTRTDTDVAVTGGINKLLSDWVTWGLIATYTSNSSNVSDYQYSKYTVLTTASFNYSR